MELGQLLKQARLEAGLSQRQLCGDQITRNMLSQIENGSAKPSMETLRYLAGRLGKPISFFLEEDTASPNQALVAQARTAFADNDPTTALQSLEEYAPDGVFDAEVNLIRALCCLSMAEAALSHGHIPHALTLLEKAAAAGSETPYYTAELERKRLLLLAKADPGSCFDALNSLPDDDLLLRANAAYRTGHLRRCIAFLDSAADQSSPDWNVLCGDVYFAQEDYAQARIHYLRAEDQSLRKLEQCCEKLGDYKMAYYYACKQR
ncbi:MAG: helix-turn-helix domain-containing protein [Oscillospiraceae bacterium]|nr:helix-turn-helix domain-containing protein [Oscillospiraceae bacterium]